MGFGPCLDAANTGQTILVDTGAVHSPYNEFARLAARAGVRHVVSVGLPLAQRSVGGLNIYCTADATPGPEFIEHAEVFASYAAVAVNNVGSYIDVANDAANMRAAMASRAVIEQAKGIIMGRDHCTAEEAFDILRRISQQKNVKVRELLPSRRGLRQAVASRRDRNAVWLVSVAPDVVLGSELRADVLIRSHRGAPVLLMFRGEFRGGASGSVRR